MPTQQIKDENFENEALNSQILTAVLFLDGINQMHKDIEIM